MTMWTSLFVCVRAWFKGVSATMDLWLHAPSLYYHKISWVLWVLACHAIFLEVLTEICGNSLQTFEFILLSKFICNSRSPLKRDKASLWKRIKSSSDTNTSITTFLQMEVVNKQLKRRKLWVDGPRERYVITTSVLRSIFNIHWEPTLPCQRPYWTHRTYFFLRLSSDSMVYTQRCFRQRIRRKYNLASNPETQWSTLN